LILRIHSIAFLPNSISGPEVDSRFILVIGLEIMQFDPHLSNKLSISSIWLKI
jgi:hypothetical protein